MKGSLRAGGVALILGTLVIAGRSSSEPKKTPAPRTRIALINLSQVIKGYHKYQDFQTEIKDDIKKFQDKNREIQDNLSAVQKTLADATATAAQKIDGEKQVRDLKRQLEDLNSEAKTTLGKKSDNQMVFLYKEVQQAAQRYAQAHDIEMVLHYNDADEKTTEAEYWSSANVARKMQAGALMPVYIAPGLDVSAEIIETLNASRRTEKKPD